MSTTAVFLVTDSWFLLVCYTSAFYLPLSSTYLFFKRKKSHASTFFTRIVSTFFPHLTNTPCSQSLALNHFEELLLIYQLRKLSPSSKKVKYIVLLFMTSLCVFTWQIRLHIYILWSLFKVHGVWTRLITFRDPLMKNQTMGLGKESYVSDNIKISIDSSRTLKTFFNEAAFVGKNNSCSSSNNCNKFLRFSRNSSTNLKVYKLWSN